ncbi:MAG TPA: helix-turn-helix domain-containing protein [Acidimicrobiia bacterium]|jgi:AcrR family transcriptional regulator
MAIENAATRESANATETDPELEARPGRRGRRRVTTRRSLLDAARRLVAERGVDGLTVAEITDAADVGFGTFYGYFETRDDLVDALLGQAAEELAGENDRLTGGLEDPAERVAVATRNTITSIDRDPIWAAFLVHAAFSKHPQIWTALNGRMMRDVMTGVEQHRFMIEDLGAVPFLIGGGVLAVLRGKLDGVLTAGAEIDAAAGVLLLLGLPRAEALEIARRPMPPLPAVADARPEAGAAGGDSETAA